MLVKQRNFGILDICVSENDFNDIKEYLRFDER